MKAIKLEKPYEIEEVETAMPQPKAGEALIRVKSAGICGSDIGAYRGTNNLVTYPRIIGHEIAGEVLSIPENEKGIKAGDKVIVDPYLYCGHCYPCSIGRTNCCEDLHVLGVHVDGGMSEYFCHPADMLVKVPDDMDWKYIPMAEPLTIALHGLHRTQLKKGEHIAVIGAGTIGLMAALAALSYGAVPILLDIVPERLELAKKLGVSYVINSAKDSVEELILKYTGGRKAEVVMEASGANAAILMTLDLVSNAGRIALTGWPKNPTMFPTDLITKKEVDIRGSRTSAGEFEEAVSMIYEKKIPMDQILTKVVSVDEAAQAVRDIEKNPGNYLKVNVLF